MAEDLRTIWCGNLPEKVTEEILYELFLQAGPLERVSIPRDRDGRNRSFGFITYKHQCSVQYALELFEGLELYNRQINLKQRNGGQVDTPTSTKASQWGNSRGDRQRTQSVPVNLGALPAMQNFDLLLQFGQQMFIPDQLSHMSMPPSSMMGGTSPYASQMGASQYLGGISPVNQNSLSKSSIQGNWSNRNHPYAHGSGHRRNGREPNRNNNSNNNSNNNNNNSNNNNNHNSHYRDSRGDRRGYR